ncbi:MAG: CorA family divalent cation transporter [Lachnospiraceae bacterium]|nr:CorA family divalent cation transporter [Lachnospiraceae bacterium]
MFYILSENEVKEVDIKELDNRNNCVAYLSTEELEENFEHLGINRNILHDCMADQPHFRNSIDIYDNFSFGIINILNVMNVHEPKDRMAFIIKKNQFILVKLIDDDDSCKQMFEDAIGRFNQNASLGKIIFGILEKLLVNGNKSIESTEKRIIKMEQNLVNGKFDQSLNRDIFNQRRDLSLQKNYYEQLFDIGTQLQENENDLFDEADLRYFEIFATKAERLSNNTQLLSDNLIHLRETLDASLNYNLNKTMNVFTVVTTIFLPLTLIVGWYGMNFKYMPELGWKYGYLSVVFLSVIVVIGCLIFFKKRKFF